MILWGLISDLPPPLIALLAMGLAVIVLIGYHVVRITLEDAKSVSIPVAFAEITFRSFVNYPIRGRAAEANEFGEACALYYGATTITNISVSRSATLNLFLNLTSQDGWDLKIPASPVGAFGQRLDRHAMLGNFVRLGTDTPVYLENPIHLKAGESVTGTLLFMFDPFDDEQRLAFLERVVNQPQFEQRLIVSDLVSGVTISSSFPASYRGKGD